LEGVKLTPDKAGVAAEVQKEVASRSMDSGSDPAAWVPFQAFHLGAAEGLGQVRVLHYFEVA